MWSIRIPFVLALLGYSQFALPQKSEITFPWVGYLEEGNVWQDWYGELVTDSKDDDATTFHIKPGCVTVSPPTHPCFTLGPSITVIVASNSYNLITTEEDISLSTTSCTMTGSPSPTKAQCSWTDSRVFPSIEGTMGGKTLRESSEMFYPDSLGLDTIYPVTLTYGTPGATFATTPTATAEVTGTRGTSTETHATSTQSSSSTTTSGNIAAKTAAPMIVLGGVLVGAVFWA